MQKGDKVKLNPATADGWKQPFRHYAQSGREGFIKFVWEDGWNKGRAQVEFPKLRGRGYAESVAVDPKDLIVLSA